jgi:hypothetical protein
MQPGSWDPAGFLRPGTSLTEVLARDAEALRSLSYDAATIGSRLAELLEIGAASDVGRPRGAGDFQVELHRQRGMITCPWAPDEFEGCSVGGGGRPTANRFVIVHRPSGERLEGFELSAHLIRDHGFFGGPGTRFRVDPERATGLLGIR